MKKLGKVSLFLFMVLFGSCAKRHANEKLAVSYYKLAMLELTSQSEQGSSEVSFRKALDNIDKALEQYQKSEYLAFKATILLKLKHEEESGIYFQKALDAQPVPAVRAEILNNYACLLAQNGHEDKAFSLWKSLENDSHYLTPEVACFNQGKAYTLKGDYNHAKDCFLKSVTFAPSYLDAQYYLALTAYEIQDLALAKNSVKTLLFLEPAHIGGQQLARKLGVEDTNLR